MNKDRRVESPTFWDVASTKLTAKNGEHKVYTGFEPRVEGAEPSNRNEDWWQNMDAISEDTTVRAGTFRSVQVKDDTVMAIPEPRTEQLSLDIQGVLETNPGETLTLALAGKAIEFKQAYPYTINTANINNINDVRHIIKALQIGLTEEAAMKLPLHLIKENDN